MKKCLLLGNGAREAVICEAMSEKYEMYSVMPYENPSISEFVKKSNGKFLLGSPFDKELVRKFVKENEIKYCIISSDNLLQDGMIDLAKELGLQTFGPTSQGAKIEWSKTYALDVVQKLAPEMMIKNFEVTSQDELEKASKAYPNANFVVKPEGLTGGKGVKVGGIHFETKEEGIAYAKECLEQSGKVIIQDKVKGKEFTVMCLTDGKTIITLPTTFDYPYRYDEDKGPGTGGMGCIGFSNGLLPFLTEEDIQKCSQLIEKTVHYLNQDSEEFTGILYGGFFKTEDGIKFIEFNARFGDPEAMNVIHSFETPFAEVATAVFERNLSKEKCQFNGKNSFLVYVVSKEYAVKSSVPPVEFTLNKEKVESKGVKLYFANAKKVGENRYTSVSNSRLFAIEKTGDDFETIKNQVYQVLKEEVDSVLDYRNDIGNMYEH